MTSAHTQIGIVCGQCDSFNEMGASACAECQHELSLDAPRGSSLRPGSSPNQAAAGNVNKERRPSALAMMAMRASSPAPRAESEDGGKSDVKPVPAKPVSAATSTPTESAPSAGAKNEFADLSQEELMEQARNFVCRSCSSSVPSGHKFCGRCGTAVPPEILNAQTLFFGDMQNPAKAKLILIRGEGMDGLSFHLKAEQHIVGRDGQLVFPDDPFVSKKHANFFYRDTKLVVRDEGSLNGVYIRVRGTVDIAPGDTFLAGEQLFRLETTPKPSDGQDQDGTYFYSSPKPPKPVSTHPSPSRRSDRNDRVRAKHVFADRA